MFQKLKSSNVVYNQKNSIKIKPSEQRQETPREFKNLDAVQKSFIHQFSMFEP